MPSFSVIIPTYNRAGFIGQAIESVRRQSCRDYELIVVDDGSTDGTGEILEGYRGQIKCLRQDNAGVGAARNQGFRAARGDWIAFLDSDDEWAEDYLAIQAGQIRRFPEAVAHLTNALSVSPHGERSNYYEQTGFSREFPDGPYRLFDRPLRPILRYHLAFIQAAVIRRDVLDADGPFDESLRIAEDLDVLCRVALSGPIAFCSRELVQVIRRQEALEGLAAQSRRLALMRYESFAKVYRRLFTLPRLGTAERLAVRKALSSNLRGLGNACLIAGQAAAARSHYLSSLAILPSASALVRLAATGLPRRISQLLAGIALRRRS